jgi:glucose dehydrogenase
VSEQQSARSSGDGEKTRRDESTQTNSNKKIHANRRNRETLHIHETVLGVEALEQLAVAGVAVLIKKRLSFVQPMVVGTLVYTSISVNATRQSQTHLWACVSSQVVRAATTSTRDRESRESARRTGERGDREREREVDEEMEERESNGCQWMSLTNSPTFWAT